ncbi:ribose-5-phosphate isomerase RpiA [Mammaliicoccus stepanovicii]|uniref:Ribose-5-phosphate isomerase A n=1 Tax=Mammaliicoccus stepanovicii TaxID=643214 RepID=A0A240A6E1_9STAP|nr:ribose-5-phosphate isomerase RpiA [Mammaliicoccus stepanovicii]PNZ79151.1 ribose-5-phosphate isomerase RpiA [Mammaliicoccus stepanovicii]GGI39549.1 ribose-5-phosphate isomerase A [Mammaliicoccus stepanovicii]SNV78533.1 ribose 5-phosphate isomerase A [Mammaliicoccus stepanovicii]
MNQDELKERVAIEAVKYIKDGMNVGLGTGSTMYYAIRYLSERVKNGLNIKCIPTSEKTAEWARTYNIPLTNFSETHHLDVVIDGADEVGPNFHLLKGGGGALLREKIVANATDQFIVIIDESKYVNQLGKFKLPIEIVPFGYEYTIQLVEALGCKATLRQSNDAIYVTDNQNYIIDCDFGMINNPKQLNNQLISIIRVVETGLFIDMANKILVSQSSSGLVEELNK